MVTRALSLDTLGAWLVKARGAEPSTTHHVRTRFTEVESWCVRATYRTDLVAPGQPVLLWVSGNVAQQPAGIYAHGRTTGTTRDGVRSCRPVFTTETSTNAAHNIGFLGSSA